MVYDRDSVFIYGVGGRLLFWGGDQWHYREPNTIHDLFCMWGTDINNIHAVGGEGTYRFHDGKTIPAAR